MEGHVAKNNESTFPSLGDLDDFLTKHNSNFVWLLVGEFEFCLFFFFFYCTSADFVPRKSFKFFSCKPILTLQQFQVLSEDVPLLPFGQNSFKGLLRYSLQLSHPNCFQASESINTFFCIGLCVNTLERFLCLSSPSSHYSVLWMDHLFNLLQLPQHRPHPHPHHQQAVQGWLHSHR